MISDELICPICDECRDHPQPFLNDEGRWVCGACWLECGMVVDMTPKPEIVKEKEV